MLLPKEFANSGFCSDAKGSGRCSSHLRGKKLDTVLGPSFRKDCFKTKTATCVLCFGLKPKLRDEE